MRHPAALVIVPLATLFAAACGSSSPASRGDGGVAVVIDGGAAVDGGAAPATTFGRLFPDGAEWNRDISTAPVDDESASVMTWLDQQGWGTGSMRIDFSIEVLAADASTPHRPFTPTDDHFTPDCDVGSVPVPVDGALEGESGYACLGDGDCHLLVVDRPARRLYEMWRADLRGDTFNGGCLAVWDLTRAYASPSRGLDCTSADAAGLPIAALLFGPEEVAAGSLDHAIRFILPNARIRNRVYVWPATHSTGSTSGPATAPPYGARLRLRADFPLESLPNEGARVVARAMMKYGIILADGGNIALTARSDRFSTVKWGGLLGPRDLGTLRPRDFVMVAGGARRRWTGDCVRAP